MKGWWSWEYGCPLLYPATSRAGSFVQGTKSIRNRQELDTKLNGHTLGDSYELEDTLQWVEQAKKRERELTKITRV
jgi:hypothetical protein